MRLYTLDAMRCYNDVFNITQHFNEVYMHPSSIVTVRVTSKIAKRLEKLAESMDRSKSYLAAEAIEEYLDYQEWKIEAIKEGIAAADRGETIPFEEVKAYWEKIFEEDSNHGARGHRLARNSRLHSSK